MIEGDQKEENVTQSKKQQNIKRGRVFVRNLPFNITEEKLKSLFTKFGEIKEVNIPKKDDKQTLKGYGFIQFSTKRDALKAIKEMNNTKYETRVLIVSLAKPKEEYITEKKEQERTRVKTPKQSRFFDGRTLFIRNLNFNTTEDSLKEFFEKFGKIISAKIVKNKETGTSKGTGFILLADSEQCEKILKIYEKSASKIDSVSPFELDGRNLAILSALPREKADGLSDERRIEDLNKDNRNFQLLFYGLNTYNKFKNQDVSEEDREKRDMLIKVKKTEFKKNPNYHISKTRITVRNLNKSINEEKLKELFNEGVNSYISSQDEEKKMLYNKLKKIKQIKLLRDENLMDKDNKPKSKCIAFIEVCDTTLARHLIDNLNNIKVDGAKKGLVLEFSLEDIRKKIKREKIISERKHKILKERMLARKIKRQMKKEKPDIKEDKETIDSIKDTKKLMEIYHSTLSRGKKQRIKKRFKKLGFNPESVDFSQKNKNNAYAKKATQGFSSNSYVAKKVDFGDRNKIRNNKFTEEGDNNVLKQKRRRRETVSAKKENNFRKKTQ